MKINRVNIGELIKQAVEARGWTNSHFAKQINIQRQNISKTVFQKESIDTNLLRAISEVLDCNFFDYYKSDTECNQTNYKDIKVTINLKVDGKETEKTIDFHIA